MSIQREDEPKVVQLTVNGEEQEFSIDSDETLLKTLRSAGYYEVKNGCSEGVCGACNVIIDNDRITRSCITPTTSIDGNEIMTVDGLTTDDGKLHPLQEEFLSHGAAQCGFCIPGMLLSAYHLLQNTDDPTREEIRTQLSGNLCRCTGYIQQIEAIEAAAERLQETERETR